MAASAVLVWTVEITMWPVRAAWMASCAVSLSITANGRPWFIDPSHFDEVVKVHPTHVHLTLSGHTHGMQVGVETPLVRWSPAQYRYKNWAGLAKENNRLLYVNRGFGFIGFSGRVGIWPEITVLELRKG